MKRIRERRKALGLTMKELGAKVGVSESAISQFETGKKWPKGKTLIDLAFALDTTVEYLLEKTENPTQQIVSGARLELFERLKDLTAEEENLLFAFLEWMKANRAK